MLHLYDLLNYFRVTAPIQPMRESKAFKRKFMGTRRDKEKMIAAEQKRARRRARNLANHIKMQRSK